MNEFFGITVQLLPWKFPNKRLLMVIINFRAQAELQIDMVKHNVQIAKGSLNVSIAKMAKTKNTKRRMTVANAF